MLQQFYDYVDDNHTKVPPDVYDEVRKVLAMDEPFEHDEGRQAKRVKMSRTRKQSVLHYVHMFGTVDVARSYTLDCNIENDRVALFNAIHGDNLDVFKWFVQSPANQIKTQLMFQYIIARSAHRICAWWIQQKDRTKFPLPRSTVISLFHFRKETEDLHSTIAATAKTIEHVCGACSVKFVYRQALRNHCVPVLLDIGFRRRLVRYIRSTNHDPADVARTMICAVEHISGSVRQDMERSDRDVAALIRDLVGLGVIRPAEFPRLREVSFVGNFMFHSFDAIIECTGPPSTRLDWVKLSDFVQTYCRLYRCEIVLRMVSEYYRMCLANVESQPASAQFAAALMQRCIKYSYRAKELKIVLDPTSVDVENMVLPISLNMLPHDLHADMLKRAAQVAVRNYTALRPRTRLLMYKTPRHMHDNHRAREHARADLLRHDSVMQFLRGTLCSQSRLHALRSRYSFGPIRRHIAEFLSIFPMTSDERDDVIKVIFSP